MTDADRAREEVQRNAIDLATKQDGYGMSFKANGLSGCAEICLYGKRAIAAHWFIQQGPAAILTAFATPPMVAESGEVIQADREAAAVFETHPQAARAVIAGRSDGSIFVQAFRDHRLSALRAFPASQAREGETWASIAAWCEETFGPCSPDRIAGRASEEMSELIDETEITIDWTDKAREEAADVLICLSRAPDIWEAVERKMAINRACEWRIMGDGTGYHIRSGNEPPAALTPSPVVGEGKDVRPSYLSTLKLVQEATFTSPTPSVGEQEL